MSEGRHAASQPIQPNQNGKMSSASQSSYGRPLQQPQEVLGYQNSRSAYAGQTNNGASQYSQLHSQHANSYAECAEQNYGVRSSAQNQQFQQAQQFQQGTQAQSSEQFQQSWQAQQVQTPQQFQQVQQSFSQAQNQSGFYGAGVNQAPQQAGQLPTNQQSQGVTEAFMTGGKHATPKRSLSKSIFEFVLMLVGIFAVVWLLHAFVFQPYRIPSGSMETTIMTGDMVIAEKVSYYFDTPKAGDIVVFDDPTSPGRNLIKRCIAVGGQTVNLVDGKVVVDGKVLEESYTNGLPSYPLTSEKVTYPYKVPDGYIWVMGDNRTNSQDSRYFGAISVESVVGRGALIYWPLENIGMLS